MHFQQQFTGKSSKPFNHCFYLPCATCCNLAMCSIPSLCFSINAEGFDTKFIVLLLALPSNCLVFCLFCLLAVRVLVLQHPTFPILLRLDVFTAGFDLQRQLCPPRLKPHFFHSSLTSGPFIDLSALLARGVWKLCKQQKQRCTCGRWLPTPAVHLAAK